MYCSTCGAYVFRADGYCYNCHATNSEETTYVKPEWGMPRPVEQMGTRAAQAPRQQYQQHQPVKQSKLPFIILGTITGLSIVLALIFGGLYASTYFLDSKANANATPSPAPTQIAESRSQTQSSAAAPAPTQAQVSAPVQAPTPTPTNTSVSTNANYYQRPPAQNPSYNMNASTPSARVIPIVNSNFIVPARKIIYYPFTVPPQGAGVAGEFSASGGMGNDIAAFVIPAEELPNLINNNLFRFYYSSGKVTVGHIRLRLASGSYYLVFSNTMSLLSNKGVAASVFMSQQ